MQEIDGAIMDRLVDYWLQSLRRRGFGERQLLTAAKALAEATELGPIGTHHPNKIVRGFLAWVASTHNDG